MPKPWDIEVAMMPSNGPGAMIAMVGEAIQKQVHDEARRAARAENRLRKVLRGDAALQRRMNRAALRKKKG